MKLISVLAAGCALMTVAAPAQAILYDFTITGDYSAFFQIDSNPTPDDFIDGFAFQLNAVPGFPDATLGVADIIFWNAAENGGIEIVDAAGGGTFLLETNGPQLYSGPESSPMFEIGSYDLVQYQGSETYKLVISRTPAVPEPASWALMIGGFAMAGASMRRRQSVRVAYRTA